jgi:hypothetical protein
MRDVVCQGSMGRTLAEFLVEHLAFLHEDDVGILDTVAVMLVSGVLTDAEQLAIWKRGTGRNSYYVAFLELQPDRLPNPRAARADHASVPQLAGNPYSVMLENALSGQGQTFVATAATILERPDNQEVVNHTLNALARWCGPLRQADETTRQAAREAVLASTPQLASDCAALDALAAVDADSVRPIFLKTTAIGSLMRRKIQPLVAPLLDASAVLRRQP